MKALKKSHLSSKALVAALLIVLSISLLTPAYAVSATTTGLELTSFDRNQGKYASCGGYEIFAFDNKLVFYTSSAVLAKTWDIPTVLDANFGTYIYVHGASVINHPNNQTVVTPYNRTTVILAYNSSVLLVASSFVAHYVTFNGYSLQVYPTVLEYFIVNPSNLAYSSNWTVSTQAGNDTATIVGETSNSESFSYGEMQRADLTLYLAGSNAYCSYASKATDSSCYNTVYTIKIYPTYAETNIQPGLGNRAFFGSTFYIVNAAESIVYFMTRNNDVAGSDYQFYLWQQTIGGSFSYIGSSGVSDSYGESWVYFGGYKEHTVSGNTYFDALISFGYFDGSTQAISVSIIRFNSSFLDVAASLASSITTLGTPLRVLSVGSPILTAFNALIDGTYGSVYYNAAGALYQYIYELSDLNTVSPDLTGAGLVTYQGLVIHFGGALSVGGLYDPWSTVGLMVDYTGSRCAAQLMTPLVSTLEYSDSWSLAPAYWEGTPYTGSQRIVQLSGGTNYVYSGHIAVNGVNGEGTVTVRQDNSTGAILKIVSLSSGNFTITFSTGTQPSESFVYVSIVLSNFNGNFAFTLDVLTMSSAALPTATPGGGWNPGTTPGGGNPGGVLTDMAITGTVGAFVNFMLLFIFIAAPALGLGYKLGIPGLLGGGMFGLAAGVLIGLIPVWFIFITAAGLVLSFMMWRGTNGKQ